jgi:hypothetical protein
MTSKLKNMQKSKEKTKSVVKKPKEVDKEDMSYFANRRMT